ncbi:hypothetical protein D3C81_1901410 [compost metagenome]
MTGRISIIGTNMRSLLCGSGSPDMACRMVTVDTLAATPTARVSTISAVRARLRRRLRKPKVK